MLDLGMLMIAGAQNPALGPQLDALGVPLPGAAPQIGPWDTQVNPAGAAPGGQQGNPLAGLQGIKAPAPITPIMHGGVTGGVNPPKIDAAGIKGPQALQTLMQAMLQRSAGPAVPNLGALVRGAV